MSGIVVRMVVMANENNEVHVIHEDSAERIERSHGEEFEGTGVRLGAAVGGEDLSCTLYEVPPGRKPVPYHYHTANEEAMYVLDGVGTLRTEAGETEISEGDYVSLPAGEEGAHQVINSSDSRLRYLCFSTMNEPDAMVYPDSNKIGIVVGTAPGGPREEVTLQKTFRADSDVDYWDGE